MKKGLLTSFFVLALANIFATVTFAEVDYSDPKQRNPQNDPDIELGYQEHQKQYKEKQEKQDSENTDTPDIITDPLPPGTGDYHRIE